MKNFKEVLREARRNQRKTLREVAESASLSIGYISDMEQGRRVLPDVEKLRKIERFLNITNGELVDAAKNEKRLDVPTDAKEIIWQRPDMMLALLRASQDYTEEEINELLIKMRRKSDSSESKEVC